MYLVYCKFPKWVAIRQMHITHGHQNVYVHYIEYEEGNGRQQLVNVLAVTANIYRSEFID